MEEKLEEEMEELITTNNLDVQWAGVLKPKEYIETWRVRLWNKAYSSFLASNASPKFHKGTDLMKIAGGTMAVDRLVYRYYFMHAYLKCNEVGGSPFPECVCLTHVQVPKE